MRYAFLIHSEPGETGCCGGVGDADLDSSEYSIEIGHGLRADPRMLAFCAHMDEIEEILLHNTTSKLTAMVMQSWWNMERDLRKQLKDSKNYPAIEPKGKKLL
jgi:hypothetical protein